LACLGGASGGDTGPYLSILNRWSNFPAHASYPPHHVSPSNPRLPPQQSCQQII
jgi:hypothetical protein